MGAPAVINLGEKLGGFADHWNPRVVAGYNGNELRLVKLQGDFTWHAHAETDELFLVLEGEMGIEFRDGIRRLKTGEMIVVPRGTEHRPFAEVEAHVLLIDREGESNTGDTPSHLTRAKLETL
ncbi:cupin domain-containing protein [Sphingomonas koreensis]